VPQRLLLTAVNPCGVAVPRPMAILQLFRLSTGQYLLRHSSDQESGYPSSIVSDDLKMRAAVGIGVEVGHLVVGHGAIRNGYRGLWPHTGGVTPTSDKAEDQCEWRASRHVIVEGETSHALVGTGLGGHADQSGLQQRPLHLGISFSR
jgi:hypothetical protein